MKVEINGMRFGVEIETVNITREMAARAIQQVTGGYVNGSRCIADDGRIWQVVNDGSLNDVPAHLRSEVVTPILTYPDDVPILQQVIRSLRRSGAKINHQCGIHVHIDASILDTKAIVRLAKYVFKQEPLIYHSLGISHHRIKKYTKPVDASFIDKLENKRNLNMNQLNTLWYGSYNHSPNKYHSSRYAGLNLHSIFEKGTVEFRWFEGTLHAGKVKSYIQVCLLLVNKAINSRGACSSKRTYNNNTAKYDFRVVLLRLGAIGDEYKTLRLHLLKNMPGCASYKDGVPLKSQITEAV